MNLPLAELCKKEIIELHQFFEEWFNGPATEGKYSLERVDRALDKDFEIISPNGNRSDKRTLLKNLERAKGSWNGEKIRIKNIEIKELEDEIGLALYEEWQGKPNEMKGRLSSAVFKRAEKAPAGVQWVHLYEIWI